MKQDINRQGINCPDPDCNGMGIELGIVDGASNFFRTRYQCWTCDSFFDAVFDRKRTLERVLTQKEILEELRKRNS